MVSFLEHNQDMMAQACKQSVTQVERGESGCIMKLGSAIIIKAYLKNYFSWPCVSCQYPVHFFSTKVLEQSAFIPSHASCLIYP